MVESVHLNDAQRDALALDRNIAVRAVAGSGKTTVLVHRYLNILEEEPSLTPANILAITFTDAAAAQLRAKLRDEIRRRKRDRRWREVYHALNDAPISTIHGFCTHLLRERPVEAGVDPDFAILDPVDAVILVRDSVRQTVARARKGSDVYAAILRLTSNLDRRPMLLIERLINRREVLGPVIESLAGVPADQLVEAARSRSNDLARDVLRRIAESGLLQRLDELSGLADRASGSARKTIERIRAVREELGRCQTDAGRAHELFDRLQTTFLTRSGSPRKQGTGSRTDWTSPDLYEQYRQMYTYAAETVGQLELDRIPEFRLARERIAAETLRALMDVYHECIDRYNEAKRARRTLDFCDLQERATAMLEAYPVVRRSYSSRFVHILVDEFQDTNRLQWQLVHRLASDDSGRLRQRGLFIVGDEAQSIYGFRNAEVEVFREVRHSIRGTADGTEIPSRENFRSANRVIGAVNMLFGPEKDYLDLTPFRKDTAGIVEVIVADSGDEKLGVAGQCAAEAHTIANRVLGATRPGPLEILVEAEDARSARAGFGDIAVLLRQRPHMQAIFDAFRCADIPFWTPGGTGFFGQQEIWDMLTALRCVAVPDNEVALAGYLRSPLGGVSDETLFAVSLEDGEMYRDKLARFVANPSSGPDAMLVRDGLERIERWRTYAGRVALDTLVRTICDETGLWMSLASDPRAPQPAHNIERLIDEARSFTANESRNVRAFLERMDYLVDTEWRQSEAPVAGGPQNAVRVMTVHQAKGLEFPVVVVAQCHLGYNLGARETVKVHRRAGIGFRTPDPEENYSRTATVGYRHVQRAIEKDARAEEMRLLHVACTRARDALILTGFGTEPKDNCWWHSILDRLTEGSGLVEYRSAADINAQSAELEPQSAAVETEVLDELVRIAEGPPPGADTVSAGIQRSLDGLERVPGARRLVDMSPTQWILYCECPRRYFYRRVIGAEEPAVSSESRSIRQEDETHTDALEYGRIVHRALELFVRDRTIDRAVTQSIAEFPRPLPDVSGQVRTIVHEFAESPLGRTALRAADIRPEQEFVMKMGGMMVQGSIDLMWLDDDGRWHVTDYKTSRSKDSGDTGTARRTQLAHRYAPQLALYALATQQLEQTDTPVIRTLYFTDSPADPFEYPPFGPDDAESLETRLAEAAAIIAADPIRVSSFPPAPTVHGEIDGTAICTECGFHRAGICEGL